MKEAENVSCDGWDPSQYPSWLLLEIEGNLTIRKRQVEVAMQMIKPRNGQNSVVQLNMGEGKTSVITPMAAAVLGNGKNLVQIIVLKPLLRQSVNVLSQRLGGLVNRRIYHVPFSRKTKLDSKVLSNLKAIYEDCIRSCGICICLPEQMLSMRLVCQDSASQGWFKQLIELETMLRLRCRDLIDESDEVLDTKFQLVYTVGTQQPLDGYSDRWEIAQHLLKLVAHQAHRILQEEPDTKDSACIEVSSHGRRYPLIRFLKPGAYEKLALRLMDSIAHDGLPGIPFNQWTLGVRNAALAFIGDHQISDGDQSLVRDTFEGSNFLPKLLILRGLFAHSVLEFTLTAKRWLVDYGLHPGRCLMAVPYRAKGIPSDNAEFGHPDVAVVLTCLSYYYEGLKRDQLRDCFANLGKGNDASTEFEACAAESGLPRSLQSLSGVNLDDQKVFEKHLYPCLRYQVKAINFYLSHTVFPREGKEFPRKLCTSAWDIPSQADSGKTTTALTTGFSGTKDNRFLHTNAMVLGHLLEPRNRVCILAEDEKGHQLDFQQLLSVICEKCDAGVLIDVGAQILEYSNKEVASTWLSMTPENDADAAVFFNDSDDIRVIDREDHVETLLSSSFRERMGACLVFLDQHHSRGVDLRLPPQTRAAVTLGPRLTKDRLVQACNRLRGLDEGQSVVFLIPPEVKHNMMALFKDPSKSQFASPDVLRWAMHQTCQSLDKLRPLWASHGLQHRRRTKIWKAITANENPTKELVAQMQEPEARTLCELYAPWTNQATILDLHGLQERDLTDLRIKELVHTLILSNIAGDGGEHLHEEQEREIAVEIEREAQVSRPTQYSAFKHKLMSKVRDFALSGKFPNGPSPFYPAYSMLKRTSVGKTSYPSSLLGAELFVTADFIDTVQISRHNMLDDFLKPVNWILSSVHNNYLVIISQYEANTLIPVVRNSKNASLHVYTPRSTKAMRSFRQLDFLTIGAIARQPSPIVTRELELFAGSLYFSTFNEYRDFQLFLGLVADRMDDIPEGCVSTDGFVNMKTRVQIQWPVGSPFWESPLAFLAALMHLRTRGQGYRHTHVGTIIDVKPLTEDRF